MSSALANLGRALAGLCSATLLLLGLSLGLAALGRLAATAGGAVPLWLSAPASAEAALGGLLLGADYVARDFFWRGVALALLSSLCFGLGAALWPRRHAAGPVYDIEPVYDIQ